MVIQGSEGIDLVLRVWDKGKPINLTGATVELSIKTGARKFVKSATVVSNGVVSATLSSEDIATEGLYYVQAKVNTANGKWFYSQLGSFNIGGRL